MTGKVRKNEWDIQTVGLKIVGLLLFLAFISQKIKKKAFMFSGAYLSSQEHTAISRPTR